MHVYPPNTPATAPPAPVLVQGVSSGTPVDEVTIAVVGTSARTYAKARITTSGTLTAHDTNCIDFALQARNADGTEAGAAVNFTTQTTGAGGTGDWTEYAVITVTISLAGPAGGSVTLSGLVGGTGVAVPDFLIALE